MSTPSGPNLPATKQNATIVGGPDTGKRIDIARNEDSLAKKHNLRGREATRRMDEMERRMKRRKQTLQ